MPAATAGAGAPSGGAPATAAGPLRDTPASGGNAGGTVAEPAPPARDPLPQTDQDPYLPAAPTPAAESQSPDPQGPRHQARSHRAPRNRSAQARAGQEPRDAGRRADHPDRSRPGSSCPNPLVIEPLTAGGTGTVGVTVRNDGGSPSSEQPFTISLPPGVSTAGISIGGTVLGAGIQQCTLPRLEPGASVTVTVSLTASADADGGTVTATLQGLDRPAGTSPSWAADPG